MTNLKTFFLNLIETVKLQADTFIQTADKTIDLVDEDVLENVPIVKYGVSVCRIKDAFHESKLKRNVKAFREAIIGANDEDIEGSIKQIELEEDKGLEIADTMMSVFLDGEKPFKASIMGNLLKSLSQKKITPSQYHETLLVVLSASVPALTALKLWFESTNGEPYAFPSENDDPQYKNLPFLISLGVALHRGDEIFISETGRILYHFGIKTESYP
jgi:hypothetical protein